MSSRTLLDRAMLAVSFAAALTIALGQPPPQQPPEPGFSYAAATDPGHDYVSPFTVVTCPPPTKTPAATDPSGTNC